MFENIGTSRTAQRRALRLRLLPAHVERALVYTTQTRVVYTRFSCNRVALHKPAIG